ncbi:MAG: tetratricopeptide repeat protein [Woeseiaceae bacterium]|nr:tetratricopeptide repeat protein [Woeseiaceae bacterium]
MGKLFDELKRRSVIRVASAYVVVAWLVIQVADTILPNFGVGETAIRAVIIVMTVGFIPAVIAAWAFEITPEGLKRDTGIASTPALSASAGRRLDRIIMVILALAVSYFVIEKLVTVDEGMPSIAVLTFEDMSPGGDQEYLSEGLADQVRRLLAGIPELQVISRQSSLHFKGQDADRPSIAKLLDVQHIVEGSVQRTGDRLRVTAQLIDVPTDRLIWSETYDRTLDDIFAIQDEIAASLVGQMKVTLLGEFPENKEIDPDAYVLYLQGRHITDYSGDRRTAVALFRQALELEPDYVDAMLELARAYFQLQLFSELSAEERQEYSRLAAQQFSRAAEINPDHPTVIAFTAWGLAEQESNYAAAAREYARAIELYPNDWSVMRGAIIFCRLIGRYETSISLAEHSVSRDPLCAACNYQLARSLLLGGYPERAEIQLRTAKEKRPGTGGELSMAATLLMLGRIDEAREVVAMRRDENQREYWELLVRSFAGETEGLEGAIRAYEADHGSKYRLNVAALYALAGDNDAAFMSLEELAPSLSAFRLGRTLRDPFLENLKDDPRWQDWLERAGIAEHQLAAIEFDPRLP